MRLFVAVAPPDPVIELLAGLPRPDRPGVRWTTRSQWHVTLRFLGEAPPDEVSRALSGAEGVFGRGGAETATATVGPSTAWFPGRRVLQVPVAGLDGLAAAVRKATAAWGPDDEPAYSGHLTLARTSHRRRGPVDLAGAPFSARFAVTGFALYSSRSAKDGPVYEPLSRYRLDSPNRDRLDSEGRVPPTA